MNNTLNCIKNKYNLSFDVPMPITLSPFHRSKELTALFKELSFSEGAEIGTERGHYAKTLLDAVPNLKLYCIDPWKPFQKEFAKDDESFWNSIYNQAKNRLSGYNCIIIRKASLEAVKEFEPNSLDFVYIDGNHDFEYVINDIISWMKIVKPGGILAGHDYTTNTVLGIPYNIPYAVQAYANAYKISPWFVLHARGTVDNWMWVKP